MPFWWEGLAVMVTTMGGILGAGSMISYLVIRYAERGERKKDEFAALVQRNVAAVSQIKQGPIGSISYTAASASFIEKKEYQPYQWMR